MIAGHFQGLLSQEFVDEVAQVAADCEYQSVSIANARTHPGTLENEDDDDLLEEPLALESREPTAHGGGAPASKAVKAQHGYLCRLLQSFKQITISFNKNNRNSSFQEPQAVLPSPRKMNGLLQEYSSLVDKINLKKEGNLTLLRLTCCGGFELQKTIKKYTRVIHNSFVKDCVSSCSIGKQAHCVESEKKKAAYEWECTVAEEVS
jgi:hypothetical protein